MVEKGVEVVMEQVRERHYSPVPPPAERPTVAGSMHRTVCGCGLM